MKPPLSHWENETPLARLKITAAISNKDAQVKGNEVCILFSCPLLNRPLLNRNSQTITKKTARMRSMDISGMGEVSRKIIGMDIPAISQMGCTKAINPITATTEKKTIKLTIGRNHSKDYKRSDHQCANHRKPEKPLSASPHSLN